jgi:hypothetical protein
LVATAMYKKEAQDLLEKIILSDLQANYDLISSMDDEKMQEMPFNFRRSSAGFGLQAEE